MIEDSSMPGLNAPHASIRTRPAEESTVALLTTPGLSSSTTDESISGSDAPSPFNLNDDNITKNKTTTKKGEDQQQKEGISSTLFPRLSSTSQSSSSSSFSSSSSSSSVSSSSFLTLSFSTNPNSLYIRNNSEHLPNSTHSSSTTTRSLAAVSSSSPSSVFVPTTTVTTTSNTSSRGGGNTTSVSHLQVRPQAQLPSISTQQHQQELFLLPSRSRSRSRDDELTSFTAWSSPPVSPPPCGRMQRDTTITHYSSLHHDQKYKNKDGIKHKNNNKKKTDQIHLVHDQICYELGRNARKENDAMVYLDGPRIYTCGECRTHLTSHDEIISKSFHGRHGRAYLFDMCVNVNIGPAEDRRLITGLHSVSDIYCKRCNTLIGWTYAKAYEPSQKYKEGKFIIEKIHLFMEESDRYQVNHPAGERRDKWKIRSMSWGRDVDYQDGNSTVYEYRPRARTSSSLASFTSSSWGGESSTTLPPSPRGGPLFHSSSTRSPF